MWNVPNTNQIDCRHCAATPNHRPSVAILHARVEHAHCPPAVCETSRSGSLCCHSSLKRSFSCVELSDFGANSTLTASQRSCRVESAAIDVPTPAIGEDLRYYQVGATSAPHRGNSVQSSLLWTTDPALSTTLQDEICELCVDIGGVCSAEPAELTRLQVATKKAYTGVNTVMA